MLLTEPFTKKNIKEEHSNAQFNHFTSIAIQQNKVKLSAQLESKREIQPKI